LSVVEQKNKQIHDFHDDLFLWRNDDKVENPEKKYNLNQE
jgi:hypothetical protein